MEIPTRDKLIVALNNAGKAHHHYQQEALRGIHDQQWPPFYAAYTLGRLGDFTTATSLSKWLGEAPAAENWSESTADFVLEQMNSDE